MKNGYLLLLFGPEGITIDCCETRKIALEKEYGEDVRVLIEVINHPSKIPHCGLKCIKST